MKGHMWIALVTCSRLHRKILMLRFKLRSVCLQITYFGIMFNYSINVKNVYYVNKLYCNIEA